MGCSGTNVIFVCSLERKGVKRGKRGGEREREDERKRGRERMRGREKRGREGGKWFERSERGDSG